jgi:hypothetical protein
MKYIVLLLLAGMVCGVSFAQEDSLKLKIDTSLNDRTRLPTGETAEILEPAPGHNSYGDLLNDDPAYNKRYPVWIPALRVATTNVFNWSLARYFFNYEWARISTQTWKDNLKNGFVWDDDRFGVNFIGHPHTGNYYFNVARSNGYTYLQSLPFAIGGSLMWEYFGENVPPSKNDIINTPLSGSLLGEMFYRVTSNILDDRTRGSERFFRETLAALINPTRALNRLTQGKMFRVTTQEVYQKEPLNITVNAGVHKVNANNKFGSGSTNAIVNIQLDYGDPFEVRRRKPLDHFRLRLESRYGDDQRLIDNVIGYGLLAGRNISSDKHGMLVGIFQHFDYWNNKIFELGSMGFGPGMIVKINLGKRSQLYSSLHIAGVPMAGNSTRFGPDTSEFRDYPFGGGYEGRIEETLNLTDWVSLGFTGYYYWIYNYEGVNGKSRIGILKPRISVKLINNIRVGIEHQVYYDNRFINNLPVLHLRQTEQKFYFQILFDDKRWKGKYH